jgi:hypothetical protein
MWRTIEMIKVRYIKFVFLLTYLIHGCATTPNKEYHFAFLENASLIEQAKSSVQKKFPEILPDDLLLLKSVSGHNMNGTIKGVSKDDKDFYPDYFLFRLKSSTKTEQIQDQTILIFDLIYLGTYEDGSFNPNGEDATKTKAISTFIDTPIKTDCDSDEQKEFVGLYLFKTTLQSLIPIYGTLKGLEFDEYAGPHATESIACFTESEIPKKYALKLIEKTLNVYHVSIAITAENIIRCVYNSPN